MSFDISRLDVGTASDRGVPMTLRNPKTGAVIRDERGEPVTITLLGRFSQRYKETLRGIQRRRLDNASRGMARSDDDIETDATELLVVCTVGWSFTEMDGQPFPFSEVNARRFWADSRFSFIRDQATQFIDEPGNFLLG